MTSTHNARVQVSGKHPTHVKLVVTLRLLTSPVHAIHGACVCGCVYRTLVATDPWRPLARAPRAWRL